jgi:hypothetical protein
MSNEATYVWSGVCNSAGLETDGAKLSTKILAAEAAMFRRLRELDPQTHAEELEAM